MRRFLPSPDLFPLLFFTLFILLAFFLPTEKLLLLFPDDSYFYLKTANHIAQGFGSTFDGINLTNGYHPLYMYLLAGLSWIWHFYGHQGLLIVLVLDGFLFLFFLYWLNQLLKKGGLVLFARLIVLLMCTILLGLYDFGNENRLLLPLAWLLVLSVITNGQKSYWQLWGIGTLSALVILARLDAILWVGFVFLFLLSEKRGVPLLRLAMPLVIPVALAAIGFIIYNWLVFGSPTTVSSYQKFGWPGVFVTRWLLTAIPALKARFYFSLITAIGYLLWYRRQNSTESFYRLLNFLAWYVCIYLLVLVFWGRGEVRFWYFCLPVSFSFVVWGVWLHHTSFTRRLAARIGIILAVLLFSGYTVHKKLTWNAPVDAWKMAEWVKKNTAASTRIFQVDGSGLTGYFSERAVINGDGLINSWEYQRVLRTGALADYLAKMNVSYLIWNRYQENAEIRINIPLKDTHGIQMSFSESPRILARFGRMIIFPLDLKEVKIVSCDQVRPNQLIL